MTSSQIKRLIRKSGIKIGSVSMSSRVRGWCSSWTEGADFSFYPWKSWSTRNGYRVAGILHDRTQDMIIRYRSGRYEHDLAAFKLRQEAALTKIQDILSAHSIKFERIDDRIEAEIDNPFSEAEVKRADEQWRWATSQRRNY